MSKRVLVVEDNELNLKLFCDLLKAHDYATEPVRDGREAVARARAFAPDLIVMDIQLPYVSGLELIETCKADAELRAIPIMAVTAYAGKEDEERVRAAGAEAYVSKPISLMRFIGEVAALAPKAPVMAEATAEEPLPEEQAGDTATTEPAFPEDLFPEDMPRSPAAEIASAEDPLPEDEAQAPPLGAAEAEDRLPEDRLESSIAEDERPTLDPSPVTPAPEPGSGFSSTAGEAVEDLERQLDPLARAVVPPARLGSAGHCPPAQSGAGVTKEQGLDAEDANAPSSAEEPPAGEAGDEQPI